MNNNIKIYVVEDMAISRASLETILENNNYHLIGSSAKAEKAWSEIQHLDVDLVLLDINLAGEKDGVWLAKQIRKSLAIPIIYLTAYGDQQTLKEVIETKPNGYLMKPYQEPNLIATITIALQNFLVRQKEPVNSSSSTLLKDFVYIKDRYIKVKIIFRDIYFIKSDGNYIEIILENKKHVVRSKLSEFYKMLPTSNFVQTHQRYIVNTDKIATIGKDFIEVKNINIPISQKYKGEIEKHSLSFF